MRIRDESTVRRRGGLPLLALERTPGTQKIIAGPTAEPLRRIKATQTERAHGARRAARPWSYLEPHSSVDQSAFHFF